MSVHTGNKMYKGTEYDKSNPYPIFVSKKTKIDMKDGASSTNKNVIDKPESQKTSGSGSQIIPSCDTDNRDQSDETQDEAKNEQSNNNICIVDEQESQKTNESQVNHSSDIDNLQTDETQDKAKNEQSNNNICIVDEQESQKTNESQVNHSSDIDNLQSIEKEKETALQELKQSSLNISSFSCDICKADFNTIAHLSKHRKKVHQINAKAENGCGICGAVFERKRLLHNHYAAHKYLCKICNKGHKTKVDLESHISVVHLGEKKFKCSECGTQFVQDYSLTKHIKKYCTKQKSCKICGEDFNDEASLIKHRLVHCYTCTICFKKFVELNQLNKHMSIAHSVTELKTLTEKSFIDQTSPKSSQSEVISKEIKIELEDKPTNTDVCVIDKQESQKANESQISPSSVLEIIIASDESQDQPDEQTVKKNSFSISCNICRTNFPTVALLSKHNKKAHQINADSENGCGICGAVLESQNKLHAHYASHKYVCTICNKAHKTNVSLQSHIMVVHTGERKYECTQCEKRFSRLGALNDHIKLSCTKQKSCMICGEDFNDEASLIKHRVIHHFTCTICNNKFFTKATLNHHIRTTHNGEKKYMCEFCGKGCISHGVYVRHRRTHTGEKPYSCKICSRSFADKKSVKDHMKTHSNEANERKYICSICNKTYQSSVGLRLHTKNYHGHGNSENQCDECGKTFTEKHNLLRHKVVHTGEKNYKCTECGKLFSWESSLHAHISKKRCTNKKKKKKKRCTKQSPQKSHQAQTVTKEKQFLGLNGFTNTGLRDSYQSQAKSNELPSEEISKSIDAELSDSCGEDFHDDGLSDSCSQDFQEQSSSTNQKPHLHDIIDQNYYMLQSQVRSKNNFQLPSQPQNISVFQQNVYHNRYESQLMAKSYQMARNNEFTNDNLLKNAEQISIPSYKSEVLPNSQVKKVIENVNYSTNYTGKQITQSIIHPGNPTKNRAENNERSIDNTCNAAKNYTLEENKSQGETMMEFTDIDKCDNSFICEYCGEKFKDLTSLTSHTQTHHKILDEPKKLTQRNAVIFHEDEPKMVTQGSTDISHNTVSESYQKSEENLNGETMDNNECDICGRKFKLMRYLTEHKKIVHKIKPTRGRRPNKIHKCKTCGETFEKPELLHRHNAKHKFTCTICKKVNSTRDMLESHMVIHTGERNYKCTKCNSCFSRKDSLTKHIKEYCTKQMSLKFCLSQTETNLYDMKMEKETIDNKKDSEKLLKSDLILSEHEDDLEDESKNTIACDICGEYFPNESSLIKHKVKHAYACTVCNKKFLEKGTLKVHMRIHTGERNHVCEVCGKAFNQRSAYTLHKRTHTGEKPYCCDICGLSFSLSGTLKTHKDKHSDEKKYKCLICGKAYKSKVGLRLHKKGHLGIFNYKCDLCDKTFTTLNSRRNHQVIHTGEKKYNCSTCGKKFKFKGSLWKHTRENCIKIVETF